MLHRYLKFGWLDNLDTVRHIPLGSISGVVFNDLDGDGIRDLNETGIANRIVYDDTNNNTKRDGRYRRITVQLKDPALRVRHRKGYDAPKDEELKAEKH